MPNKPVGLTDAKIKGLPAPQSGQAEWSDHIIPGLRIRVGKSGAKTFVFRKRVGGEVRNITIGRFSSRFTLADARKKARSILIDIESGKGAPKPNKDDGRTQTGRITFSYLWKLYIERAVRGKKRSAPSIERTGEKYLVPQFGDRLADTITRSEITTLVEDVTYRNPDKPTLREGRTVHQHLSAFYTWAMPKLEKLQANPCQYAGRPPLNKPRERYLSEAEIRLFWQACDKLGWPFGPGFKLLLLTGQRRGEVFDASIGEIDMDTWIIPGARAKNGKMHIVPLVALAKEIIGSLPAMDGSEKLFPVKDNPDASVNGFSKGHPRLLREMAKLQDNKPVEHFILHDLRRTVATGMQRIGVPMPVTDTKVR
ncbi:MAG: integrase family protein [Novosphingobium sp.]